MTDPNLPDNIVTATELAVEEQKERLEKAKRRADVLGLSYAKNAKAETIEAKIKEHLEKDEITANALTTGVSVHTNRKKVIDANMALVRIAYTNMNPQKTELRGEFITVANDMIGSVTRFVPYGVDAPTEGTHVEYCIYKQMRDRKFVTHKQIKDPQSGKIITKTVQANEYTMSILPPLTKEELQVIAERQNANGTIN